MENLKIYDRTFKESAIMLAAKKNRFIAAKELGVPPSNIYRWQKEVQKYGTESFCGKGSFRNSEQKRLYGLKKKLVRRSMSRRQNHNDNAVCESFFKSLKAELLYGSNLLTGKQMRAQVHDYIENWYNKKEGILFWAIELSKSLMQ